MRHLRSFPAALLAGSLLLVASFAGEAPGRAQSNVIARVGGRTITAADLERRLASMPPFQLRTFGRSPEEVRRNVLLKVLVRELLLAQSAADRHLDQREDVAERITSHLRSALLMKIRAESGEAGPPTDQQVKAYYDAHPAEFHRPARIAIWRILVDKREQAEQILAELKKDPALAHWTDVARERSLDRATNQRGGNLGFVAPDGTGEPPDLRFDPKLYQAVAPLKDGEIVTEPVPEGTRWAVVWRRASMRPVDCTLEDETPAIRQKLAQTRTDDEVRSLVERLRKERLSDFAPDLVDAVSMDSEGDLKVQQRPGVLPLGRRALGSPVPVERPGGVR